jgi:hypothetical protein
MAARSSGDTNAVPPVNYASTYVYTFGLKSFRVLGTADDRYGEGFGIGYGRPEPRFSLKQIKAQLEYEAYYDQTDSSMYHTGTYAEGLLGVARWYWPRDRHGRGFYADLGFGFQYANTQTFDLDTRLNSTPITGFGGVFRANGREYLVGLRWLHISNAGTDRPNRGQNELLLMVTLRL